MRTGQEVDRVMALRAEGLNACAFGSRTSIPRGTVRDWLARRIPDFGSPDNPRGRCPVCRADPPSLPQPAYTYLLGRYLGDPCLSAHPRGVRELRISCANAYPEPMRRCGQAITEVRRYPGDLRTGLRRAGDPVASHNRVSLSVARRASVALLDEFVESKR